MIEKQKKAQADAIKKLEEEETKKLEAIADAENTTEKININALTKDEDVDIDDIWNNYSLKLNILIHLLIRSLA